MEHENETVQPAPMGQVDMGLGPLPPQRVLDTHLPTGIKLYGYGAADMRAYAAQELAAERERCAKPLEDAAARLLAPKRTNDVDRHVAGILQEHAARIRGPNS